MSKRKSFSPEFKREAVRLLEMGDKPTTDLARELGVNRNKLYSWKDEVDRLGESAFPGAGSRTNVTKENPVLNENRKLRKELAQAKEEVEILKKAAAFFARELK